MTPPIGWRFPPTNGGRIDGFNDPGIAHFSGSPLASLARETIQNSLDARDESGTPVHVSFELIPLNAPHVGGGELINAIDACKRQEINDTAVQDALTAARECVQGETIRCLRVSDRNTIGLRGGHWRALVKMQGVSHKPDLLGAGGSHGVGKYAPFAVSALRAVFYWTCYEEDGRDVELCQGKSVLMSHESEEGETQGTGFYGVTENCSELRGNQIPRCFRLTSRTGKPIRGTSLVITGFRGPEDWRRRIGASVIGNYFHAIATGGLTVLIEPEGSTDHGFLEIDSKSLESWFDELDLESVRAGAAGERDTEVLAQARTFWEMSTEEDATAEKQDGDFGHCRLWVRVADGLPSKVGFVRRTGMLVTTRQRGLLRFPGFQDFAALCVFEDPTGNELLRRMENPKHDQFEPARLPEQEQERGRRALRRIVRWIRETIREQATSPSEGKETVLSELATYLPDLHPEEPFDDADSGAKDANERGFGEAVKVDLRPVRRPRAPNLPDQAGDDGADGTGAGNGEGEAGGGGRGRNEGDGGGGGTGEGDGDGGTGFRGGRHGRHPIPISCVRILPDPSVENRYQLSFRADAGGVARLALQEAGDSSVLPRDDIRLVGDDLSLDSVRLVRGQRAVLPITADAPIVDRAWRLTAVAADGDPT